MFALNDGPRATKTDLRAAFLLSALIKLGLLAALYLVTGGAEMAEDWDLHIEMGSDPVGMHAGQMPHYRQFPPMIGYFLAPGVWLVDAFGRFIGLRLWFLTFDLIAFGLVLMALPAVSRRALALIFVMWTFVPLVPFAGFVMIQDEMIGLVFAAAALLALSRKNETLAIAATVWGVAAGKIFLIFAFPGFGFSWNRLARIGVIGAGVAAIAYGPFLTGMTAVEVFSPDAVPFGVSYPTLLDKLGLIIPDKFTVTGLSFVIAAGLLVLGHVWTLKAYDVDPLSYYAASFAIFQLLFCTLFYHITQEYFILAAPAITLFYARRSELHKAFVMFVLLSWNWVTNVFYGIEVASERPHVPQLFKTLNAIAPLDPVVMHTAALGIGVVFNAAVLVWMIRDFRIHCRAIVGR